MGLNEYIKIGNRIKKLRKDKNISQKDMANMLNIPRSTYSNYENNNREPSIKLLEKIAEILNVSLGELFGVNEEELKKDKSLPVGENIRKYRKIKGLTMKELGTRVGITEQAISQYERSIRNPSLEVLLNVSNALDVPLNVLFNQTINLSQIPTNLLIEELNKRKDFPIKLEVK